MRGYRSLTYLIVATLLAAAPAAAHRTGGPVCYSNPPPRNDGTIDSVDGYWEELVDLGVEGIHAIHLPPPLAGKIMVFGWNTGTAANFARIYDPETGALSDLPLGYPAFCGGHTHLADGRILIAGGNGRYGARGSTVFDPATSTFTPRIEMNAGRFYPTLRLLADGRVLVLGGTGGRSNIPEIWDPNTNAFSQLGCALSPTCPGARLRLHWYPRTAYTPGGKFFLVPASRPLYAQEFDLDTETWTEHSEVGNLADGRLTSAPAVYYDRNLILRAGSDIYGPASRATAEASVIDITDLQNPTFRLTTPMVYARNRNTLTQLPDGTIMSSGGVRNAGCQLPNNDPHNYAPEIWDPVTETWDALGPMQAARSYHSSFILLRDGSILASGGEPKVQNSQIFRPPYLFKGPRPMITSAPTTVEVNTTFDVLTPDPANVAQVTMVKLGAVTHAYDQSQHFVRLSFTTGVDRVTADAPADNYEAPPGYYLLFLISNLGVPSVAEYVRVEPENPW
jgi:galactose oxidase